jgi:hypothetical protein
MLLLWLAAAAWSLMRLRRGSPSRNVIIGLIGVAIVYGSLVVTSVALQKFVVYGRLARQLVPFFCLITVATLHAGYVAMSPRARRLSAAAVITALIVQSTFNFMTPLRQVFPPEILQAAHDVALAPGVRVLAVNAKHLYPGPEPAVALPASSLILQTPHPLQYLPYQYEGYSPAQRAALRSTDISMRLLRIPPER